MMLTQFIEFGIYLNESNLLSVATETLSAAVQTILPDQTVRVPAHTATHTNNDCIMQSQNHNLTSKYNTTNLISKPNTTISYIS
jgi:phage terminase large subunit-like protein